MMEQSKDSSIKLARGGGFCSRTEESVQLMKRMVVEMLSIGWLRAITYRRDGMHNSRIVRGWVLDNWDRNER
jgi:hypothetical protein